MLLAVVVSNVIEVFENCVISLRSKHTVFMKTYNVIVALTLQTKRSSYNERQVWASQLLTVSIVLG